VNEKLKSHLDNLIDRELRDKADAIRYRKLRRKDVLVAVEFETNTFRTGETLDAFVDQLP
jgi:hypothetical protein